MGRGVAWTAKKAVDLARVWIWVMEDPILGVYQTSQHFTNSMFDQFSKRAPGRYSLKQYSGRGARPVCAKWDEVSADCQRLERHFALSERVAQLASPMSRYCRYQLQSLFESETEWPTTQRISRTSVGTTTS